MFSSVVESHFLRLKLSPYAIILNPPEPESPSYDDGKGTGITDGDSDNNGKDSTGQTEIYVHPLAKSYACNMSGKSLDMCTESLGSETGSEISDSSDDILFLSSEAAGCDIPKRREKSVTRGMSCCSSFPPPLTSISGSVVSYNPMNTRRMTRGGSFPPPLTSISGSNGVRVTSHREGGRLVLQAVSDPTCHTYMHAERSEGRLRLCFLKEGTLTTPIFDYQDGEAVEEEADDDNDDEEGVVNEEQSEGRLSFCHSKITTVTTPIFDGEDGELEERGDEGVNVKSGNIGGKLEMGKLARPISCKYRRRRHKGFIALEPYLVAT